MNPIFIVGTGRCGSSVITEIIARHAAVGFITNIDNSLSLLNLKGRWNNVLFRTYLGRLTRNPSLLKFAPSEAYKLISEQVSPVYANSSRDLVAGDVTPWLERRFKRFFEERRRRQGKPVFLHKYTGWSRMGFFSRIFPQAKFIHIVRDGRSVANSWLQMPWWQGYRGPENWLWGELQHAYQSEWLESDRSYARLAAIGWKLLMDSYEQAAQQLPPQSYHELRYEDFLDEPRQTIETLLDFMDLAWTPAFNHHFRRQKIRRSRNRAFERDLSPQQLNEIENSLGDKLIQYGYMTGYGRVRVLS